MEQARLDKQYDRDLNYTKYFGEGEKNISKLNDCNSHNTKRLNIKDIKSLLLKLNYIKEPINA